MSTMPDPRRPLDPPSESIIRRLFPLPLVPFELLMLLDDRPDFPMTFCVEMVFRGRLDRSAFQQAADEAVARHPLLRARVAWSGRQPAWELIDSASTPVTWLTPGDQVSGDRFQPIDVRRVPGLRLVAESGEPQSRVWMHFHHACCDGQGARRFGADLLTGYARACQSSDTAPGWDVLDYDALRRRSAFARGPSTTAPAGTTWWQKLRDAFHFHCLTPRPLAPPLSAIGRPHATTVLKHAFDFQQSELLLRQARERNVNLNDVAMGLLFQTLADWNKRYGGAADSQRLRVLMPTDLRSLRDVRLPAANRMSFAFVARTIDQCQNWDTLVAGIGREIRYYHQVRIGLDFLDGISLAGKVPGLLSLLLGLPRCLATAILTNLGDPTRRFRRRFPVQDHSAQIGNLVLEHVFGTPPLRPHMHAGFGLCVCSRRIGISMLGNRAAVGEQADELLQQYIQRWCEWGDLA